MDSVQKKLCYKSNTTVTNLSIFMSICFLDVYLVCHGGGLNNQTSTSTMVKCTDLRKYAFSVACLLDFFFLFWCVQSPLKIFDTFLHPIEVLIIWTNHCYTVHEEVSGLATEWSSRRIDMMAGIYLGPNSTLWVPFNGQPEKMDTEKKYNLWTNCIL